jgi:hypothetical protein
VRNRFLAEAKRRNLYLESAFDFRCRLGSNEIRIWGEMFEPSESGECGADPGGKFYLSLDGLPMLHFLNVGNACFPSVWRGSLTLPPSASRGLARLVLCGYDRFGTTSGKEPKCVTRGVPPSKPPKSKPRPLFYQDDLERMLSGG